jgi:tRNA dimethylallyltransferase
MKRLDSSYFIVIAGPTAVGKTDFAIDLALLCNGEIINADVGQFYAPLTIGTAKPDWRSMPVKHHLFDIFNVPKNFTAHDYRSAAYARMKDIWAAHKIP